MKINKDVRFRVLMVAALAIGFIVGAIIGYSLDSTPLQGDIRALRFDCPCSIVACPDGFVYVVDAYDLYVIDRNGAWNAIKSTGGSFGQYYNQGGGLAVGSDSTVYMANTLNNRVEVMSPNGRACWGSYGTDLGQFNQPSGVAAGPDGTVYVADTGNARVQMRAPDGTWTILGNWNPGKSFSEGPGQFYGPYDVAVGSDGTLYVADYGNDQIQMRTPDGTWTILGSHGSGLGQFTAPSGMAMGSDGTLYVADYGNNRIQMRAPDGTWTSWGSYGTAIGQFRGPSDVAVSPGGTVYVADFGNNCVQARAPDGTWRMLG